MNAKDSRSSSVWQHRRDRALTVVCATCGAWIGQRCLNVKTGQPIRPSAHPSRLAETEMENTT